MTPPAPPTVAFIGFGEAAQAFCKGWPAQITALVRAFDIKTDAADTQAQKRADYATAAITGCDTVAGAQEKTDVIFSMVTADQALAAGKSAAQSVAQSTLNGALYFDCNSCAPDTKRAIARIINAAGGRYVDVAVMAPVHPKLHQTPVLASGAHAAAAITMMDRLNMSGTLTAGEIGAASSIKMVRSIMVKGLESLMAECLLAGRRAGVEDIVFDTLDKSYPGFDFRKRAAYALDRMIQHGHRRASEMSEVALTVDHLGLSSAMSRATAQWQQSIGDLALSPLNSTHTAGADAILAALDPKPETEK